MTSRFVAGLMVQTPFGKGVIREVRNNGRLLVDVQGRSLIIAETDVSAIRAQGRRSRARESGSHREPSPATNPRPAGAAPAEVDLHGLSVEDALARVDRALDDAILADIPEVRLIHGRSGGAIRAALHRRLREIPTIHGFRLDPRNEGVTIVSL